MPFKNFLNYYKIRPTAVNIVSFDFHAEVKTLEIVKN